MCDESTVMLAGSDFMTNLVRNDNLIPIVAIVFGCSVGMVAIISGMIARVVRTRALEQSRRELAAYVAEGSIEPDQAVEMLNAGQHKWNLPDLKEARKRC